MPLALCTSDGHIIHRDAVDLVSRKVKTDTPQALCFQLVLGLLLLCNRQGKDRPAICLPVRYWKISFAPLLDKGSALTVCSARASNYLPESERMRVMLLTL